MINSTEQMLMDLCNRSDNNKHLDFYFLTTWRDYRELKRKRKQIKIFSRRLAKNNKHLLKSYCKELYNKKPDFNKLLAYNNIEKLVQFCKDEIKIITEIIYEYEAYLFEGNLLDAFSGHTRSAEDLRDFREDV